MRLDPRPTRWTLALGALILLSPAAATRAEDRSADAILAEIKGVTPPTFDAAKRGDRAAQLAFMTERRKAQAKKADLIGELAKIAPSRSELVKLLPERWTALASDLAKADGLLKEIDEATARFDDATLRTEGGYLKANLVLMKNRTDPEAAWPAVEAFAKASPKEPRLGNLLMGLYSLTRDEAKKVKLEDKILKDFPDSPVVKQIEGARRQRSGVGKPFELGFIDAINGSSVSMKGLKGKVVVVDFWATWCPPCVAEMPTMKKLYAEYKPKGVEFIGVSLDAPKEQGGLDALKAFVAKNEITWPQFHAGDGEFATSWGIAAIPTVFIVDAEGKLHSTEAGGEPLESLIAELLKKAHPAGAGGD